MSVAARRPATYEDLRAVPDHLVAEILDGELVTSPRPATPHAYAAGRLFRDVSGRFDGPPGSSGGGWWILIEPELHLGPDVLVPDVCGWRHARMPVFVRAPYVTLTPDWVCEVVSPSTMQIDRTRKLAAYGRAGVGHLWLVDPLARTLEIYRRRDGQWVVAAVHGGDELVRAEPFEDLEVDLARWWPPAAEVS